MVESNQCFLAAQRLDLKRYGSAHQVSEGQIYTICVDQLQNGPPKSPQNEENIKTFDTRVQGNIFVTQNLFVRIEGLWSSLQTEV